MNIADDKFELWFQTRYELEKAAKHCIDRLAALKSMRDSVEVPQEAISYREALIELYEYNLSEFVEKLLQFDTDFIEGVKQSLAKLEEQKKLETPEKK